MHVYACVTVPDFFLCSAINLNFLYVEIISSKSRSSCWGIVIVHLDVVGEPVLGVLQSSLTGKEMGVQ
jgi:hypothetical protein